MKFFRSAALPSRAGSAWPLCWRSFSRADAGVLAWRHFVPDSVRPERCGIWRRTRAGYGALLTRLAAQSGKPCDVIFIGASNIEGFGTEGRAAWERYYAPRHAFNFGVAGDKTQDVLWRFDHLQLGRLQPKVAVVFVGLNNLPASPRDVAMGIERVTERTRAAFPGIKVMLVSLTRTRRASSRPRP